MSFDAQQETKVVTELYPTPAEAKEIMSEGLVEGRLVVAFGPCEVEYDGRAASDLGIGERLLIMKPDGVVEIHADEHVKPRNWQPSGSSAEVSISEDGVLTVTATRTSPTESLEVYFPAIHQVSAYTVDDSEELSLLGTEDQMQDRIMENPTVIEEGFRAIESERSVSVGAIDVFGRDADGRPVILELKRRRTGPDSVDQLRRYVEVYGDELEEDVRGILVAPSITESAERFLEEADLEHISLKPQKEGNSEEGATLTDFVDES